VLCRDDFELSRQLVTATSVPSACAWEDLHNPPPARPCFLFPHSPAATMSRALLSLAVAVVLVASVSATTPMTWKSCSSSSATCKVSNVTMTPDPAVLGQSVSFSVTCDGTTTVTGGKSQNIVYLFGLKVLDVTKELCSLTTCPIKPGSHTITGVRTTISCPAVALFGCMPVVALHGV